MGSMTDYCYWCKTWSSLYIPDGLYPRGGLCAACVERWVDGLGPPGGSRLQKCRNYISKIFRNKVNEALVVENIVECLLIPEEAAIEV